MVERLPTVVPSWLEWLLGSGNRSSKVLDLEVSKQE
jgi:hypothetical protein